MLDALTLVSPYTGDSLVEWFEDTYKNISFSTKKL